MSRLITFLIFIMAVFIAAGILHDNKIMREKIERMERAQVQQAQEIRQAKTDAETAIKIVVNGDIEK